jgi:hypothetical protein
LIYNILIKIKLVSYKLISYRWIFVMIPGNGLLLFLNFYYFGHYLDFQYNFANWKKKVKKDYHKFIEETLLANLTFHLLWLELYIDYSYSYSILFVLFLPFIHVSYFIYHFTISYYHMMKNSWGRYYLRNCNLFFYF